MDEQHRGVGGFLHGLAGSPWIIAGVAVYTVEFVVCFAAISRAPSSVAFPFNALAYCGVVFGAARDRLNAALAGRACHRHGRVSGPLILNFLSGL